MTDLECAFVTFNSARALADPDFFAQSLYQTLKRPTTAPDLLILALEELAPIAYSFLGGSYLTPYFVRYQNAIDRFVELLGGHAIRFENVLSLNAGLTGLMLFAQPEIARNLSHIETACVRVGNYELGNKGAVGARFAYHHGGPDDPPVELTFVSAHLAPGEEAWQRRNADWRKIVEQMVFTSSKVQLSTSASAKAALQIETEDDEMQPLLSSSTSAAHPTSPSTTSNDGGLYRLTSHLFVAGDLNYRTSDLSPEHDEHLSWPDPSVASSDPSLFATLWARDQLTRELSAGRTLHHLHEPAVHFPPTYKYSSAAQRQAGSAASPDSSSKAWATHRAPSWCDRILYLPRPSPVNVELYTALPVQPTSDHRPVLLRFSVPARALDPKGDASVVVAAPFGIDPTWRSRRDTGARRDTLVGLAAYLVLTWEGEALLLAAVLGVVGAVVAVRNTGW